MQVKIINLEETVKAEKRQNLPFKIKWICPDCGKKHTDNYLDSNLYVSYASLASIDWAVNEIYLSCDKCDFEMTKKIGLRIEAILLEEDNE